MQFRTSLKIRQTSLFKNIKLNDGTIKKLIYLLLAWYTKSNTPSFKFYIIIVIQAILYHSKFYDVYIIIIINNIRIGTTANI